MPFKPVFVKYTIVQQLSITEHLALPFILKQRLIKVFSAGISVEIKIGRRMCCLQIIISNVFYAQKLFQNSI